VLPCLTTITELTVTHCLHSVVINIVVDVVVAYKQGGVLRHRLYAAYCCGRLGVCLCVRVPMSVCDFYMP
jgi:hypothetical protein